MHTISNKNFFNHLFKVIAIVLPAVALSISAATLTIDFDDSDLPPGGWNNGSDGYGANFSHHARLDNNFDTTYKSWDGFALSRVNNNQTSGAGNQYAVWGDGLDRGGSGGYAVGYYSEFTVQYMNAAPPTIVLPCDATVRGVYVNNTTYAALSMMHGDSFGKKFGGSSGTEPDWLKLTVTGLDAGGNIVGEQDFYLADFRFEDDSQDYIVSDWTWLDLASLGRNVRSLQFAVASSDVGAYGMNTPSYFALDDLQFVPTASLLVSDLNGLMIMGSDDAWLGDEVLGGFSDLGAFYGTTYFDYGGGWISRSGFYCSRVEDTSTAGFENQAAVWGNGKDRSGEGNYAIYYDAGDFAGPDDGITFARPAAVQGFYINNSTYAALSMLNGDSFGKKFGGPSGNDPDWLKLDIAGYDSNGELAGTVEFYLADYRSNNSAEKYVVDEWTWVDLSTLGPGIKYLRFYMSSSDSYIYDSTIYYNTPLYFAMDELIYHHSFSGPLDGPDYPDTGIPGFVGPAGPGLNEDFGNTVNPLFSGWASGVADYLPTPGVWEQWQDSSLALGQVTGYQFDVVSLGDLTPEELAAGVPPGQITLTFDSPICDKEGPDFAVFENGFIDFDTFNLFAELGYVEVSSDGVNFARFPSASFSTNLYGPYPGYENIDTRYVQNLCGIHVNNDGESWGTPFDLGDLAAHPLVLDGTVSLSNITHVRIIDIPGDGSFFDDCSPANPIRDAWPTWGSGGVDLEAVGVINSAGSSRITLQVEGAGEVTPCGYPLAAVSVIHGQDQLFSFVPEDGLVVRDVSIDGVSVGATNEWLFADLQDDHILAVTFGAPLPPVTIHDVPLAWLDEMGVVGNNAEERALSDQDGDGFAAWQEYHAGTDPTDPDSCFTIRSFEISGSTVTLSWPGDTSGSALPFTVMGAVSLSGPWTVVADDLPKSASGINTWSGVADESIRFFRIAVRGIE